MRYERLGLLSAWRFVTDALYPKRCVACGRYGAWACGACLASLAAPRQLACPDCGAASPLGEFCDACAPAHELAGVWPAQHYGAPLVRELIHKLKFDGITEAAPLLASIACETMKAFGVPPAWHEIPRSEWRLTPVPLPPVRERMRGFNQTELLAQAVARELSFPVVTALRRRGLQRPQSDITDETERRTNVRGVFEVAPEADTAGKVFVLVDDVYTSGATMDECARVLKTAGAHEVWGLTMAKG